MTSLLELCAVLALAAAPAANPATWIPPGPPPARAVQLMNGGRLAATGLAPSVLLHDLESGKDLQRWALADAGACYWPPLATDGERIAAACGAEVIVLSPNQPAPLARWRADGGVNELVFSADGRALSVLTGADREPKTWRTFDALSGAERLQIPTNDKDSSLVQSGVIARLPDAGRGLMLGDGGVTALRFRDLVSRENNFILTGLPDGGTGVLRAHDRKQLWSWPGMTFGDRQKFGRDGALVILGDPTTVYDANTGAVRATADCGLSMLSGVSPDGRWAVGPGRKFWSDQVCRLDVSPPRRSALAGAPGHLTLSDDGRALLALSELGVRGWSIADGGALKLGLEDAGVAWHPDYFARGAFFFVRVGEDGLPVLIDTRPPGRATRLPPFAEDVTPRALCTQPDGGARLLTSKANDALDDLLADRFPFAISSDCRWLARVTAEQAVELRSLPAGQVVWKHAVENVAGLGFSDDDQRLAVVLQSPNGFVQLVDVADPRRIEVLSAPNLLELQVNARDVYVWNRRLVRYGGNPLGPVAVLSEAPVSGVRVSSAVALQQTEYSPTLWVTPLSERGAPLPAGAPLGPIQGLALDAERLVAWGPDGASARDLKTGAPRPLPLRDPSGPPTATAWAAGVRAVISNGCLTVGRTAARPATLDSAWKQGECIPGPLPTDASAVSISSDGRWALTAGYRGQLTLWDLQQKGPVRSFGSESTSARVALRDDGKVAYRLDAEGELSAWSIPATRKLWTRKYGRDGESVVAAPRGGGLAVIRRGGAIDVLEGEKLVRTIDLASALDEPSAVAFSPDGARLFVGTERGALLEYAVKARAEKPPL